jgi:hypothetical protein
LCFNDKQAGRFCAVISKRFANQVLLMTHDSNRYFRSHRRRYSVQYGAAVFAVLLMIPATLSVYAQGEDESCPCFSYEEVESMFLSGEQLTAEQGVSSCEAQDYSVECNAEVVVWDQDYSVVAQARIDWYDFDPSRCDYIDTIGNPGVERSVKWPHPAPEATARACFEIIASVIAASDTSGKCNTYP